MPWDNSAPSLVTFAAAFPTSIFGAILQPLGNTQYALIASPLTPLSVSTLSIQVGGGSGTGSVFWLALGN